MTTKQDSGPKGFHSPKDDLVFSLADGFVWASWPGTVASIRLGDEASVTAVMRDFLAQCELGHRLTRPRN